MKNFISLILFVISVSFNVCAQEKELTPNVFLNKITQRLIGSWPLPSDYEALQKEMKAKQCAAVTCLEGFFRNYIREKMNRAEFYTMFYTEVTERMGYRAPISQKISEIINSAKILQNPSLGRDFALVYRTLKENQSFDQLFTSQIITDPVYSDLSAKAGTYNRMTIDDSQLPARRSEVPKLTINYENGAAIEATTFDLKGHPNIAGLFSSNVFLLRYWNTPENVNRKRAAAYFRIMMCDMMSPALDRETEREKEHRLALGITDEEVIKTELKRVHNRHASQKDCAMCHNRIDPIGDTFRGMEVGISGEGFKGKIRYNNSFGELTNIEVKNFQDLIVKTTQQPKYLDCQMNWLIEAYLGKDLSLPPTRFAEVLADVEKKQRRIKTVIEDLLMLPEFRGLHKKVIEPPSLVAAKEVLSNCSECHGNTFSLRPEQMKSRLNRITVCLDLPNDGKTAEMPPSDHYWQPSADQVMSVKKWIQQGAPLQEGAPLFNNAEVEKMFKPNPEVRKCRQ